MYIFSRVLRNFTPRFVGRSVGRSVGHTLFFYDFYFRTSLLLPKWSSDLKYGPYPPARDFGSRVSGLVFLNTTENIYFIDNFFLSHTNIFLLFLPLLIYARREKQHMTG